MCPRAESQLTYMIDIALIMDFSLAASGAMSGGDRAILAGGPRLVSDQASAW
jgi:hypothetical protein